MDPIREKNRDTAQVVYGGKVRVLQQKDTETIGSDKENEKTNE